MSLLRPSTRRPPPLTDADYDHQIQLVDQTEPQSPQTLSRNGSNGLQPFSTHVSDSSSRRNSDVPLYKHSTPLHLREELVRRKFAKYQDRRLGDAPDDGPAGGAEPEGDDNAAADLGDTGETGQRGRTVTRSPKRSPKSSEVESYIDILYENQRGGFLCGLALFSSKALGALDHAPWTNSAHKPSATNITNAQVPDPSWEWAWLDWHVNLQEEVDEDGWEYSFAFGKHISWHGPQWWNSFVRRRAWTRKRVKKRGGYQSNQPNMLTPEYFTIHPAEEGRSRATSMEASVRNQQGISPLSRREVDEESDIEDITNIGVLLSVLRFARIDREKMEAVENFVEHGEDDLGYLSENIHAIMHMFIFQASRRLLLAHLLKIFNEASAELEQNADAVRKKRLENLEAAVKHADEEVQKLEFWSDIKDMAKKGQTKGAVDKGQGWDKSWTGLDHSGPKSMVSEKQLPGMENCKKSEGNGTAILTDEAKGKQKAQD